MKFHEYKDAFTRDRKDGGIQDFEGYYAVALLDTLVDNKSGDYNQYLLEREWIKDGRPYYNVFPKIVPHLFKVKEEKIPVESVNLPNRTLCLRFTELCPDLSFEYEGKTYYLKTALAGQFLDSSFSVGKELSKIQSITVFMDIGETYGGTTVYTYQRIPLKPGTTIGEAVKNLSSELYGVIAPKSFFEKVLRMICTICMLSKDIDDALVIPDVINSDKKKLDTASNEDIGKLHMKARRNGKFGWNVGERMMVAPHVRSGTPLALYWTGKGRTQMLYRSRKGCVVHRKIVDTVPSGYEPEPDLVNQ